VTSRVPTLMVAFSALFEMKATIRPFFVLMATISTNEVAGR